MNARRPPQLLLTLELEQRPVAEILAASAEDEERLLRWLEHADAVDKLPAFVRGCIAAIRSLQDPEAA
jgi:hypothetical protein